MSKTAVFNILISHSLHNLWRTCIPVEHSKTQDYPYCHKSPNGYSVQNCNCYDYYSRTGTMETTMTNNRYRNEILSSDRYNSIESHLSIFAKMSEILLSLSLTKSDWQYRNARPVVMIVIYASYFVFRIFAIFDKNSVDRRMVTLNDLIPVSVVLAAVDNLYVISMNSVEAYYPMILDDDDDDDDDDYDDDEENRLFRNRYYYCFYR
uniref:Uncharacterized protein n=1 Tax=Glossina austeni TaxID=7395 RepID=A0A1A9VPS1_GLOAU